MEPFHILFVDDEAEFLQTMLKRLIRRQLNVIGAASGEEALELLNRQTTDLVVLDVRMPGMDGIETLRKIKKTFPLIEVIMLTGHANVEVAVEGMELGAFDYLMKPVDIDELVFKLQDAYKNKKLQEKKIENLHKIGTSPA